MKQIIKLLENPVRLNAELVSLNHKAISIFVPWSLSLPCLWQCTGTVSPHSGTLFRGPVWSLVWRGQALEVGLCAQGQCCLPAQQLLQGSYFSISSLYVLKRSPGHVMLELIGTKKFMGSGTPFLVEKRQIPSVPSFPWSWAVLSLSPTTFKAAPATRSSHFLTQK